MWRAAGCPLLSLVRTPTEARLRAIWESVLGVAPLRADDEFFDVGGTSLAAVRIFQLIRDRMGVDLPVSTLLRASTTAALAAVIDGPPAERFPALQPLRPGTGGSPLFVVHALHGDVLFFRPLALLMSTDRPVYGLQARGLDPREEPPPQGRGEAVVVEARLDQFEHVDVLAEHREAARHLECDEPTE